MSRNNALRRATAALLALLLVTACSSPASMTPQQKEAYELRRYCEQNPNDTAKCLGYLGFV
jgi:outer membrane biogenesis lipoprotein LolB